MPVSPSLSASPFSITSYKRTWPPAKCGTAAVAAVREAPLPADMPKSQAALHDRQPTSCRAAWCPYHSAFRCREARRDALRRRTPKEQCVHHTRPSHLPWHGLSGRQRRKAAAETHRCICRCRAAYPHTRPPPTRQMLLQSVRQAPKHFADAQGEADPPDVYCSGCVQNKSMDCAAFLLVNSVYNNLACFQAVKRIILLFSCKSDYFLRIFSPVFLLYHTYCPINGTVKRFSENFSSKRKKSTHTGGFFVF